MRATLLLCDHAVVAEGKLYISGAGWSVTGPDPASSAIALKLDVPWDLTNQPIEIRLRLVTEDGAPVLQAGPAGPSPIEVVARLEVGRPVGVPAGSPIDAPLAVNLPALPLAPGSRYSWVLEIDGEHEADWHLAFSTRPAPAPPGSATALPQ